MKRLLFILIVIALILAAARFLPWWLSVALIAVLVMPVVLITFAFFAVFRIAKKELAKQFPDVIPQKKVSSLAAGKEFRGNGFGFTFPVACEVSQTVIDDFEALILKPKVHLRGEPGDSMLIVSTIPKDEMKKNVTKKLDAIFSKIEELRASDFSPLEVGQLAGEGRTFEASKDGKSVRGESVYLGKRAYSVAWQIITAPESFDEVAGKYRELAPMIQRVAERKTG